MAHSSKCRLDSLLVARGLVTTKQRAQALILARKVLVNGVVAEKSGREVHSDVDLVIKEELPYVSRGGLKLEAALDAFGLLPAGLNILDAGASTGGFTDCLLQRGAARVLAVDVGYGQLDWKLRTDSRVILMERTNIRLLDPASLPFPVDAAVADLSFISLKLILPVLAKLIPPSAWVVPLVKPQFEVGREDVGKGGVVRDVEKITTAVNGIRAFAETCDFKVVAQIESPITGPKGNREFLLHLVKR